jgi:hypothetical protein
VVLLSPAWRDVNEQEDRRDIPGRGDYSIGYFGG